MSKAQLDMFDTQRDLFPAEPASYAPDPDRVRRRLNAVLLELRMAETMPWDRKQQAFHQLVFPQMSSILPDEERSQYIDEFRTLFDRLAS